MRYAPKSINRGTAKLSELSFEPTTRSSKVAHFSIRNLCPLWLVINESYRKNAADNPASEIKRNRLLF